MYTLVMKFASFFILLAMMAFCGGAVSGAIKLLRRNPTPDQRHWCRWMIVAGTATFIAIAILAIDALGLFDL